MYNCKTNVFHLAHLFSRNKNYLLFQSLKQNKRRPTIIVGGSITHPSHQSLPLGPASPHTHTSKHHTAPSGQTTKTSPFPSMIMFASPAQLPAPRPTKTLSTVNGGDTSKLCVAPDPNGFPPHHLWQQHQEEVGSMGLRFTQGDPSPSLSFTTALQFPATSWPTTAPPNPTTNTGATTAPGHFLTSLPPGQNMLEVDAFSVHDLWGN